MYELSKQHGPPYRLISNSLNIIYRVKDKKKNLNYVTMPPKQKKITLWVKCSTCLVDLPLKEVKNHTSTNCPTSAETWLVPFISNNVCHCFLDIKNITESSELDDSNLVFIHQATINQCNLVIGDPVLIVGQNNDLPPIVRRVWPTNLELTSIYISSKDLDCRWRNQVKTKISLQSFDSIPIAANTIYAQFDEDDSINTSEFQHFISQTQVNKIISPIEFIPVCFYGKNINVKILSINDPIEIDNSSNNQWYLVKTSTKWVFNHEMKKSKVREKHKFLIGGVDNVLHDVRSIMKLALSSEVNQSRTPIMRSVLLYGPSGTGKTMISKFIAAESGANIVTINTSEVYSKFNGETEAALKKIFAEAIKNSPSIILIDEIDVLCPKSKSDGTKQDKRVVSTLATLLESLHEIVGQVFVLATSNKSDMVEPSLRRYKRIDLEINVPVPTQLNRFDMFEKILFGINHTLTKDEMKSLSDAAHGFVGADIANLCTQASMHMLGESPTRNELNISDFLWALKNVNPSAMREVLVDVPNVKWSDIGGQDDLKLKLKQAVEWPLKHAHSFTRLGIKAPSGILMYGPPGCSKTMIAKALANESRLNFLSIKGPELFSKWVGESERAVRELFRKARQVAPSIIFFDEIDALGRDRSSNKSSSNVQERVLAQILTELDGISPLGNVTIVAATNRPDKIDNALLRPGRLDRLIYVPLPDDSTRLAIFNIKLAKMPLAKDVNVSDLIDNTEGYSGAEIQAICHEAAMKALEENIDCTEIMCTHFNEALKLIQPRTPASLLSIYDNFEKRCKV